MSCTLAKLDEDYHSASDNEKVDKFQAFQNLMKLISRKLGILSDYVDKAKQQVPHHLSELNSLVTCGYNTKRIAASAAVSGIGVIASVLFTVAAIFVPPLLPVAMATNVCIGLACGAAVTGSVSVASAIYCINFNSKQTLLENQIISAKNELSGKWSMALKQFAMIFP
jgi:hypothetical protein